MSINTKYSVILDAARLEHEMEAAHRLNPEGLSLYKGQPEEELSEVAPYLFSCYGNSTFLNWVLDNGWSKSWGIFILSDKELNELHRHFRRFLMVKTEDGRQLYFRYYDPRVLRIFLPTCDAVQLREFFGPISKFICEDEDPAFALIFFHDNMKLITQRIPAKEIFSTIGKEKPVEQAKNTSDDKNNAIQSADLKTEDTPTPPGKNKTPETQKEQDSDKPRKFRFY